MTKQSAFMAAGVTGLAVFLMAGCASRNDAPSMAGIPAGMAYTSDGTPVADMPSYANPQCVRAISSQPAAPPGPQYVDQAPYADRQYSGQYANSYATGQYGATNGPQYVYQPAPPPRTRVVVKRRPFRRSFAIVAGSAAAGAGIGALAGGAPGAGIGAIAGGSAGFIYDRLTHKKRVVIQQ